MATLTWPSGSVEAFLEITTFAMNSRSRVNQHDILDGPPVYTTREAGPNKLTLTAVSDSASAAALYAALRAGHVITIVDVDRPELPDQVIAVEDIGNRLDPNTQVRWIVTAGVAEVIA